jgi:hypothetical protein
MPNKPQRERHLEENPSVTGIVARRDGVPRADAKIDPNVDQTVPRLPCELFDPYTNVGQQFVRSIADILDGQDDPYRALKEIGVGSLDGTYADLCIDAVSGDNEILWELLRIRRQLERCHTSLDFRSSRNDLDRVAIPIFAASDVTPEITILLDSRFSDRTAKYRHDVFSLCLALAEGCRVYLVVTGHAGRTLWKSHRDQLPLNVTERFDSRTTPSPGAPRSVAHRLSTSRGPILRGVPPPFESVCWTGRTVC